MPAQGASLNPQPLEILRWVRAGGAINNADVLIVGGGVIGMSIAWRCAQRGLAVTVLDPAVGAGASSTAAGMLAPVTELHFEGRDLLALNLESAARYPDFVAELSDVTGLDVDFRRCGTVQVAWDAADLAALRQVHSFQQSLGVESSLLTSRELRTICPALASGLPGGLWAENDHQIDNRRLHAALRVAAELAGVTIVAAKVVEVLTATGSLPAPAGHVTAGPGTADGDTANGATADGGMLRSNAAGDRPAARVTGVITDAGERFGAGVTVLAAGAWSRHVAGIPADVLPPVRPVKGQTLRIRAAPSLLHHVVRGSVKGNAVYVVPRSDGELVIGASSEEAGFDMRPRAGAVYELLRDATTLVPELSEAEFLEVSTSLRPGSPDNAPMIGASGLDGLVIATGHYRNGILLTPVTADEVTALITDGETSAVLAAFAPTRFRRSYADSGPTSTGLPHFPHMIDPAHATPAMEARA
jgi:glycine oxidase